MLFKEHDIVVGVATHKSYAMPSDGIYLPLHVGAVLHPEICQDMQGDDTGDSISEKNPFYCELTALYWLWKNCDASYKGLVHYRRYLGSPDFSRRHAPNRLNRIASGDEIRALLKSHDVIVAKKRNYLIETVYDHYAHTFDARQFDVCREILQECEPEYVSGWDRLMYDRGAHIFNMFVMRSDFFDDYCAFVFKVLARLEQRIDPQGYDAFGARYLGRVSERLLDPWLDVNKPSFCELPVVSPEPVDWFAKGKGFLAAKFLGRKYKESF